MNYERIGEERWVELLDRLEVYPPFYSPQWLKIYKSLRKNYEHGAYEIRCRDSTYLFPFLLSKTYLLRAIYSGPLGTYGGPVLVEGEHDFECIREFISRISKGLVRFVVNLEPFNQIDPAVFSGMKEFRGFTHILNLKEGDAFTESFLRGARKAEREGVRVEINSHLNEFLEELFSRKGWLDKRVEGKRVFFEEQIKSGVARLFSAVYRDQPKAHIFVVLGEKYAFYHYGVAKKEFLDLRPNNLLHKTVVEKLDVHVYNLGSSLGLPGVEEFKRRMGAKKYETLSFVKKIL